MFCVDSDVATKFRGKWTWTIGFLGMKFNTPNAFFAKGLAWYGPNREKNIAMLRRFCSYPGTRIWFWEDAIPALCAAGNT